MMNLFDNLPVLDYTTCGTEDETMLVHLLFWDVDVCKLKSINHCGNEMVTFNDGYPTVTPDYTHRLNAIVGYDNVVKERNKHNRPVPFPFDININSHMLLVFEYDFDFWYLNEGQEQNNLCLDVESYDNIDFGGHDSEYLVGILKDNRNKVE